MQIHEAVYKLIRDARKVWMEENPVEDGTDHVTPFDQFLYYDVVKNMPMESAQLDKCKECRGATFERRHDGSFICVECKTIYPAQGEQQAVAIGEPIDADSDADYLRKLADRIGGACGSVLHGIAASLSAAPAALECDRRRPCDLRAAEAVAILLGEGWAVRDEKWERPPAPVADELDAAIAQDHAFNAEGKSNG